MWIPTLTEQAVAEFQELCEKEFGIFLEGEELRSTAHRILMLCYYKDLVRATAKKPDRSSEGRIEVVKNPDSDDVTLRVYFDAKESE